MNKNITSVLCFVVGLAVGSVGTWFYCDKSAKKRIDEEIEKQVRPAREMYERLCDQKKMAEKNREEKEKLFEIVGKVQIKIQRRKLPKLKDIGNYALMAEIYY